MSIDALNDSRKIGICILVVVVLAAVTILFVALVPTENFTLSYDVSAAGILVSASAVLICVFSSKVYPTHSYGIPHVKFL